MIQAAEKKWHMFNKTDSNNTSHFESLLKSNSAAKTFLYHLKI